MTKKEGTSEYYILSSGRVISPNMNIIGIDENGEIHEGYDTYLEVDDSDDDDEEDLSLTPEEKSEIAQEMIRRWSTLLIVPIQY